MFNNRGQTLVLFVIILPILLLLLILILDVGKLILTKNELNNINSIVMDYGLSNLDKENLEEKLVELIKLNKDDVDNIDVKVDNSIIYITMNEKINGIFTSYIDIPVFDVELSYIGYIDNNKKRIERMGV